SSNQIAFLTIIAHYINNDGKVEELLISFQEISGQHTGDNMAGIVWNTLKTYGLNSGDKVRV
ncbi:hypothetical protein BDQ17DRAFT_1252355, partial [Cyathus striatus]